MKRGICIGLNYEGTPYELSGCAADARNLKLRMQAAVSSYHLTQFEEFTDELSASDLFSRLDDIRRTAKPSDVLYLTFSGHGTQIPGDEPDGLREGLCLFTGGRIEVVKDYDLTAVLAAIPGNVFSIYDCCFSGGMKPKGMPVADSKEKFVPFDPAVMTVFDPELQERDVISSALKILFSARLYCLYACAENEVSYDTSRGGLFTIGFVNAYDKTEKKRRSVKAVMHGAELFCTPDQTPFYECYGGNGGKRIF